MSDRLPRHEFLAASMFATVGVAAAASTAIVPAGIAALNAIAEPHYTPLAAST